MQYEYGISYAMEDGLLALIPGLVSGVPSVAFSLATYVLSALALYAIASRRGINSPWLSWVPVANIWILGSVSDQYQYVVKGEIKSKRKILLTLNIFVALFTVAIVSLAIYMVVQVFQMAMVAAPARTLMSNLMGPLLGIAGVALPMTAVAITLAIFRFMALYDLYTSCWPQNNVLFLVLSILFPVTEAFFLFFSRNKDLGMPPRRQENTYIPNEEYGQPQWQEPENHEYL